MNNYWSRKRELSISAAKLCVWNEENHSSSIEKCVDNTLCLCRPIGEKGADRNVLTNVQVTNQTTVDAIFESNPEDHICALNFASFRNPGGKFLEGSSAQEESLCHNSILYNVLCRKGSWYEQNSRNHINQGLYADRGLLSRDVLFFKDCTSVEYRTCDILTVAAVNRGSAIRNGVFQERISFAMNSRIDFTIQSLIDHCKQHNMLYDRLILGAFGCGVFKNDPLEVSRMFYRRLLDINCEKYFKNIIFAIYGDNHAVFDQMLKK